MHFVLGLQPSPITFTQQLAGGPYPYLIGAGPLHMRARAGAALGIGSTENPSVTVRLSNQNRRVVQIIGRPLRVGGMLYDDADTLVFSGTVANIVYGLVIELEIGA